jgi:hypothetical protein
VAATPFGKKLEHAERPTAARKLRTVKYFERVKSRNLKLDLRDVYPDILPDDDIAVIHLSDISPITG